MNGVQDREREAIHRETGCLLRSAPSANSLGAVGPASQMPKRRRWFAGLPQVGPVDRNKSTRQPLLKRRRFLSWTPTVLPEPGRAGLLSIGRLFLSKEKPAIPLCEKRCRHVSSRARLIRQLCFKQSEPPDLKGLRMESHVFNLTSAAREALSLVGDDGRSWTA